MSSHMKYVVIDDGFNIMPFIFPSYIAHEVFYQRLKYPLINLVSAGFVEYRTDTPLSVFGTSHTLGKGCRYPEDVILIRRALGWTHDSLKLENAILRDRVNTDEGKEP